jgi:MFS superfamily sulfate permease-like transporter
MKLRETFILRIAVILIGIPILALCIFWLPGGADFFGYPVLTGVYATAISFFFALYQTLKLLGHIDKNKAFSELSVDALKNIKYCAITISIIYAGLLPFLYPIADADDAPGILGFPLIFIFASSAIAVFAAVLQKLLKEAIDIKRDNDLTI